ncbi:hypothetical protein QL285_053880 [Trifolium repens]|jgi:hypothetical protein|nr:hypothetical protein QL285_053880 [Trifolium repens]
MAKTTASFVLVLVVAAILNGYCAENAAPPLLVPLNRCQLLHNLCFYVDIPESCEEYHRLCPLLTTEAKTDNPKVENLP